MSDNLSNRDVSSILRRALEESLDELLYADSIQVYFANHVLATFENVIEQKLETWKAAEKNSNVKQKESKTRKRTKVSFFLDTS